MTASGLAQTQPSEALRDPETGSGTAPAARGARLPGATRTGSEHRQRQHVVGVRLDDAERIRLESRAGDSGLSLGAYLRACALETAGPRSRRRAPLDRELLAHTNAGLNRIGNNLNQIARALNRGRDEPADAITDTAGELRAALALLRRALGYDRQG